MNEVDRSSAKTICLQIARQMFVAETSPSNYTRVLVDNLIFYACLQSAELSRYASSSSASVLILEGQDTIDGYHLRAVSELRPFDIDRFENRIEFD